MSSQRGNVGRTRPQKHKNRTVFKNDRHDTNIRTKRINQVQINNVCARCKAVLEWKIKYKKYKMIKTPRTCNKCDQKTVKEPYHTMCSLCSRSLKLCPKCEVPMMYDDNEALHTIMNNIDPDDSRCSDGSDNDDYELGLNDSEEECAEKMSKLIVNSS